MRQRTTIILVFLVALGSSLGLFLALDTQEVEAARKNQPKTLYAIELLPPADCTECECDGDYSGAPCYVTTEVLTSDPCEADGPACQPIPEEYDISLLFDNNTWPSPTLVSPSTLNPFALSDGSVVRTAAIWFAKGKGKGVGFASFSFWGRDCEVELGESDAECEFTYKPAEDSVMPAQTWDDINNTPDYCEGSFSGETCTFIQLDGCFGLVRQQSKGNKQTALGTFCIDRVQLYEIPAPSSTVNVIVVKGE